MSAESGRAPQDSPTPNPTAKQDNANVTPEAAERLLNIATAAKKDSTRWKRQPAMTWDEFKDWLDLDSPADHRECGGYLPALLANPVGRKRREDVVSRSVLTLDADQAQPDFLADVARVLPGVAVVVHTTWRNGVEGSRYRLLVPLSRDVDGARYERLAEAVRDALGDHWSGDKGCPEPERFSWRPSTQGKYHHKVWDGDLLDVDSWSEDEPDHREAMVDPPVEKQKATQLDAYTKAVIERELAKLDECDLLGWQGPGWDSTTYEVACNLIELANSPWSGYTLDQAEANLLDRAPTDEDFGPKEHSAKWSSAEQKVDGQGRSRPGGSAADDFAAVGGAKSLDVSNTAVAAEWLRQEVGRQETSLAGLFRRGGGMVHTPRIGEDGYVPLVDDKHSEDGPAQVRSMKAEQLRAAVNFRYDIYKLVGKDKTKVEDVFPADAATLVYNAVDLAPNLRPLAGVTHTPMLRRDGSVLSAEGYDEASARLYLPEPGMTVLPVPDAPTAQEVKEAYALIDKMIAEFPFNTKHDEANYLALLFTPLVRVVVPPPYPLGLIHAHQPGSGKSYLARILRTLHGGALRTLPGSNEEFRKQITSILAVTTAPVVQFDNVNKLSSEALDALLTTDTWSDRPLGVTADFTGKNDRLWVATGNNVAIGGDLVRRIRWVNIDPNTPNPEARTGFTIPDLPAWVKENRGELLSALLTLLRAWVVEGKPLGPEVGSDDFSYWTRAMQGVLGVAGWTGTVGHVETIQEDSNEEEAAWGAFLAAVWEKWEGEPWLVKDMLAWVDPDDLPDYMDANSTRSVGKYLRYGKGRWAGGYVLRSAGTKNNTGTWKVEQEK